MLQPTRTVRIADGLGERTLADVRGELEAVERAAPWGAFQLRLLFHLPPHCVGPCGPISDSLLYPGAWRPLTEDAEADRLTLPDDHTAALLAITGLFTSGPAGVDRVRQLLSPDVGDPLLAVAFIGEAAGGQGRMLTAVDVTGRLYVLAAGRHGQQVRMEVDDPTPAERGAPVAAALYSLIATARQAVASQPHPAGPNDERSALPAR